MSAAFLRDITENIRAAAQQADIAGYIAYAPAGQETLFDGILAEGTRCCWRTAPATCRRAWTVSAARCCMPRARCSTAATAPCAC